MPMTQTTLMVCTTCRGQGASDPEAVRPGAMLAASLSQAEFPANVRLQEVECLSACKTGCAIALAAPGCWTYVYGHLDPELHLEQIVQGVAAYAASSDGLVPWRERPEIFRKQSIARIPPQEQT